MLKTLVLSFEDEKKIHQDSIEILAKKLYKETGEVALIYMRILDNLQKQARVKIFLPILVTKKVKELIVH